MKIEQPRSYYPVFLDIRGRKCVVFGGGQVARRKVEALLEHGAHVEVISPDLCPELGRLAEDRRINVSRRPYRAGDLRGALIAIAATGSGNINQEIVKEARGDGVLVNVVDGARESDFIAPSYLRRGNITIAVSTAGSSPALARKIRARLEEEFGDEYASLAFLVEEVRAGLKRRGIKVSSDDWQKALDLDMIIGFLKKGEIEKARLVLLNCLESSPE
jgi:precorrin-2 dehydrogenase/sirohydrochlorin ferrochelatase